SISNDNSVAPESTFTLRIQVKDVVSQQPVSHASLEVFANYTLVNSTTTGRDGVTVLRVPYTHSWPLTLVARKDGYIQTPLLWKTKKMPIFSSVTLPLFYQNQGNIWLFEDLVIITGKLSDNVPPANVQFSKKLLSLPDSNISSLTAYLTVPQLPVEKHFFPNTTGIMMSKSGYRSFELHPIAAVSVQLSYNGTEMQISGPVQITLPLTESSQSQLSYTVPAWSFDRKTGAWVNDGLGTVKIENRHLVWVYTASHLDYWIAAPFPSSTGYMGHKSTLDFISYNAYLLVPVVGGALVIAVGLLAVVSCYCRESLCEHKRKRVHSQKTASKKSSQVKSSQVYLYSAFHNRHCLKAALHKSTVMVNCVNLSPMSKLLGFLMRGLITANLRDLGTSPNDSEELIIFRRGSPVVYNTSFSITLYSSSCPIQDVCLSESLVLYNQSAAQASGSRSAMLPRKAVHYSELEKTFEEQTLTKIALLSKVQQQTLTMETTSGETREKRWNCLLESVSVPDILNKATGMASSYGAHQGSSEQTLLELSRRKPFPHPKAWFVSLEGKPVAQVCHSILDLQKCQLLLSDSQDTSLDSGVDFNEQHQEQNQSSLRRNTTHTQICSENADPHSCDSDTIIACTPEELFLKNTHQRGSGTVSYLPEEKCDDDMSYKGNEFVPIPQVQELRNTREKLKS
ncbi:protein FAM171B, partial [Silurus asotus]